MSQQFLVAHWTDEALEWVVEKCKAYHIQIPTINSNSSKMNSPSLTALPYKKLIKLNVKTNNSMIEDDQLLSSDSYSTSLISSNSILPLLLSRNGDQNDNVMSFIFDHFSQLQLKKIKLMTSMSSSPSPKTRNIVNIKRSTVKRKLLLINKVANSFLSLIQKALVLRVFGQCISWTTPLAFALSRFGNANAVLQIDVNEEDEGDDDDSESENEAFVDEDDLDNYFKDENQADDDGDESSNDDEDGSNNHHLDDDDANSRSAENQLAQIFHLGIHHKNSKLLNSNSSFYFSIEEGIRGGGNIIQRNCSSKITLQQQQQKEFLPVRRHRIRITSDNGNDDAVSQNLLLPITKNPPHHQHPTSTSPPTHSSVSPSLSPFAFPSYLINTSLPTGVGNNNSNNNNAASFAALPSSFVDAALEQQTNYSDPQLHQDVFVFPLVIGSVAKHRGAQATQSQPFEWKIYVRGPHFEDLSPVVEKVVFRLHHTFDNPIRVVDRAPFELVDCGWGQFVIGVDVHFISEVPSSCNNNSGYSSLSNLVNNNNAVEKQQSFFDQTSGVAQVDSSQLFSTSQTANLENTSCFPVLKSNGATMVVKLSHFLRFDKGPKNTAAASNASMSTTTATSTTSHCIPPLGRPYTNGAENYMPEVSSDGDPCVWEEYDELVFVRPPPRLRLALKQFPYGQEAVPKKNTVSWKGYIEKFGLPTSKLVNDEAEYQALVRIHKSLSEFVEEKLRKRALNLANNHKENNTASNNSGTNSFGNFSLLQSQSSTSQPQFSFTTTTSAAANAHVARGWAQWRRQAESILQDLEK